jgi:hypothetical protein
MAAVKERLTREMNYWDHRAEELKVQELAGRTPKLNSAKARARATELEERLKRRTHELELERQLSSLPPVVVGGAIVVPQGLLDQLAGTPPDRILQRSDPYVEALAMRAVISAEEAAGRRVVDVSKENLGYDVLSRDPVEGLRFIEVKGRAKGSTTVTVTRNEILTCLNAPDRYWLAIVEVEEGRAGPPVSIISPFHMEPDFGVTSVNYSIAKLVGPR